MHYNIFEYVYIYIYKKQSSRCNINIFYWHLINKRASTMGNAVFCVTGCCNRFHISTEVGCFPVLLPINLQPAGAAITKGPYNRLHWTVSSLEGLILATVLPWLKWSRLLSVFITLSYRHGPFTRWVKLRAAPYRREYRECVPCHRGLAIPTCIKQWRLAKCLNHLVS